jgi:flagellar hook-basal body complex protein FliE
MINPVGKYLNISEGFNNSNKNLDDIKISFTELLKENISKVNQLQKDADQLGQDFALGEADNIHQLTIATEKVQLALNLTLAIQNKVLSAYQEIMRMQL